MISSEVQRTLVKSPPELWSELSDVTALARHLGEFGEIRITRVEAEKTVEWESDTASGTVLIKPSGWGTKVTLSVTREVAEPEINEEPELAAETEPAAEAEPTAEPELTEAPEPATEPVRTDTPAEAPDPEPPRRGFFARLFRRRVVDTTADVASLEPIASPEPPEAEPTPEAEAEVAEIEAAVEITETAEQVAAAERAANLAEELRAAEEAATEEVTAVLTSVLDRLGAAHHRPFSRA